MHIPFIPGRHRSGFFFILVLSLLTDVRDDVVCPRSPVHHALQAATEGYFAAHPHFRRGDHNERKHGTHRCPQQKAMESLSCRWRLAQAAKVYPPESDGPRSRDEFAQEQILICQTSDHEFMIKDGRLWCHALQDCIISTQCPIVKFWGGIPVWVRQEERDRKE